MLDVHALRGQFPALAMQLGGRPVVFLDNPGGTQVPQAVVDAIGRYLATANANHGGAFLTSQRSDAVLDEAHAAMADFLNASSPDEIVFGPNMTTLTFSLSRALGRWLRPGDEIVVTRMDHDANITPWTLMAEDRGATVRWVDFDTEDYTLDLEGLRKVLNERTRIVAVGYASNALGTVNDVATIARWAHEVGALVYVDAVQYAPHGPIDVQALGCDFLVCSAYKFYGPHVGVLYGRYDLLDRLPAYKVRPAPNTPPGKFQTGTQNHEGIAGVLAAVDFLAEIGRRYGQPLAAQLSGYGGRRLHLKAAMALLRQYDHVLSAAILDELEAVPGVRIYGITDRSRLDQRVPTVSFTWGNRPPRAVAEALGRRGIFVWDGNYYAVAVTERLGLEGRGGMVRVGAVFYNTVDEVRRLGRALWEIANEQ
ncbi:MAG: cysteine desulfurase-like protein [Caldilineales bacterium]|nr:cysteine desulfurase-like protein [Caldilineales bacterium]